MSDAYTLPTTPDRVDLLERFRRLLALCVACDGTGRRDRSWTLHCPTCGGTGRRPSADTKAS